MPAAGLAPVTDAQGEELAFPLEVRGAETALGGMHFGKTGQPGQQVGGTAENLLQVLRGIRGDLRTEAASGHVEEQLAVHLAQVDRPRRLVEQRQRRGRFQGNPGGAGEIVGGAQRQDRQARLASPARQRFGHLAQRAVATAGDQRRKAGRQRLLDDAPGVAVLPGYPHRQLPPGLALCRDRGTNLFVARLLAVQDQQNLVLVHRTEPLVVALSLPIDRVSGTEVRRPVQAG